MQLITERKHSPLTDYSDEVRNLYNFINSELKKKKKNEDFITYTLNIENIDVPVQEYSIKIDDFNSLGFSNINIKNLGIEISVINSDDERFGKFFVDNAKITNNFAGGKFHAKPEFSYENGVYDAKGESLMLEIYSYKLRIYPQDFFRLIYHEFNHIFKDFNNIKNNKTGYLKSLDNADLLTFITKEIDKNINFTEEEKYALNLVLYKLFFMDELYAFSNSIDGELYVILSKKKFIGKNDLQRTIEKTCVWQDYLELNDALDIVKSISYKRLFYICELVVEFANDKNKVYNKFSYYYDKTLKLEFARYFLNLLTTRLNIFRKRILKIVNNYVEMNESFNACDKNIKGSRIDYINDNKNKKFLHKRLIKL